MQMLYKKINVELIVVADQPETVVAELTPSSIGCERDTLFGGGTRPSRSSTGNTEEIAICAYDGRW
jgi:hypothetical protein